MLINRLLLKWKKVRRNSLNLNSSYLKWLRLNTCNLINCWLRCYCRVEKPRRINLCNLSSKHRIENLNLAPFKRWQNKLRKKNREKPKRIVPQQRYRPCLSSNSYSSHNRSILNQIAQNMKRETRAKWETSKNKLLTLVVQKQRWKWMLSMTTRKI